jgi:ADP-ribose pyrophosphatase YjhB (NUDIX family)
MQGMDAGQCRVHSLTADVVVVADSAVLLVRPASPADGAAGWRLVGDALRFGEPPEAAARRALREQVGLDPEGLVLAEVESTVQEVWTLTFHFRCEADRPPSPGPQILEARFFQVEHLPDTAHGSWEREVIFRVVGGSASTP